MRDLLLDRTPKDFDIATSARPSEVKTLFRNCRIVGRRFRLAHVLFGANKVVEVATFRRDPSSLGADGSDEWEERTGAEDLLIRQDNVFGEPHEDAVRRDFTINALFYDLEQQQIVDYVGGLAEIERRVIRTIGEPDVRFREDPVRILRAIKFAARLDLAIEPDVYDAMVAHREDLLRSARPRLLEELLRLLRGGAAHRSCWLAWETGTLAVLLPELSSYLDDDAEGTRLLWKRLSAIDAAVANGHVPPDAVLLAALLLEPVEEAIQHERDVALAAGQYLASMAPRLALPRRLIDRARHVIAIQRRLRAGRVGNLARRDSFADAALLFSLDAPGRGIPPSHVEAVQQHRDVSTTPRRASQRPRAGQPATEERQQTLDFKPLI